MARFSEVLRLVVIVIALSLSLAAQSNYVPAGIPQYSSTIPIPLGFIDPLTGQVHLEISVASVPQRNGASLISKYIYDSRFYSSGWQLVSGKSDYVQPSVAQTSVPCSTVIPSYPSGTVTYFGNLGIVDSNGTFTQLVTPGFQLYYGVCSDSYGHNMTEQLTQISGVNRGGASLLPSAALYAYNIQLDPTTHLPEFEVWAADGTVVLNQFPGGAYAGTTNGNTGGQFTTGPISYNPPIPTFSPSGVCANSGSYYTYVTASDGSTQTYTLVCQTYSISGYNNGQQWTGPDTLPASMLLPDGTSYTFSYDTGTTGTHTGALTSFTLPTGGRISLSYALSGWVGIGIESYLVSSVTLGGGTWNLSPAISCGPAGCQIVTTVTGPSRYDVVSKTNLNDTTIYSSTLGPPYFTSSVQYNSGASTTLRTVVASYGTTGCLDSLTTDSAQTSYKYASVGGWYVCSMPIQKQEFDFGATTPTRTTTISYLSDTSSIKYNSQYHIYNRPINVSVFPGSGTGSPVSSTTYTYDEYSASYCTGSVPMLTSVTGAISHDDVGHGFSFLARGNVTSISKLVSSSTYVTSHKCYDTLGNITQEVDEAGNATNYDYAERWSDTSCIVSGTITRAFPTTITDAMGLRTQTTRYSCTGLTQAVADENDISASRAGTTTTYDWAGRTLCVSDAGGGQTCNAYFGTASPPYSTQTTKVTSTISTGTKMIVDGYGRTTQTQITTDPISTVYTDTTYDALGHTFTLSNPYRSTTESTYGLTTYYYDALGRGTFVVEPDSSSVNTTYFVNVTTTSDEAGNKRKMQSDALGRLTNVWEDPSALNYETDYFYDVLDNLVCVQQQGGVTTPSGTGCAYSASGDSSSPWRIRRFNYDGLSRLTSSTNPESGAASYTYYSNGPVQTKTTPAPNQTGTATVTTNFSYDADGRMMQKSYPGTTFPSVSFWYDGATPTGCKTAPPGLTDANPKGYRTAMCDGSGATSWSHDAVGRIKQERRTIGAVKGDYETDVYNLDGSVASSTTLGYNVAYTYNTAGQAITANNGSDPFSFVTRATYSPFGAVTAMTLGANPINISNSYSSRLQPSVLSANTSAATIFSLSYDFHSALKADNGNVFQIVNNRDNNRTQNYTYDSLNRIQTAYTAGVNWGETFTIDAWGNLTNKGSVNGKVLSENLNAAPASNKNQLNGFCSDSAGNLLLNTTCPTGTFTPTYNYDAENRLIAAAGVSYIYDGDGKRVEKCTAGTTPGTCANNATGTLYWTGSGSDPLAETDLTGNVLETYIFFNGQRIARRDGSNKAVHFYFSDHLGTHALITDQNGTMPPQAESDYFPYGGEIVVSGSDTNHFKFTGKERDTESGLDNFGARYYASTMGRFMIPDDSLIWWDRSNPQSLNLYAYALNNPTTNTDDGHDCVYLNNAGNGVESVDQSSSSGECGNTGGYWVQGAATNAQINGDSLELTGTTNGVDNNTHASYLTNGDVPLNPFAQQALGQAGVLAAPGVNLAAKGLEIFGWMYSAPAMLLATCASGGPGCNGPSAAMAILPEVGALREGAVLLKEGAAVGKGAEILQKAGGVAQAAKDFEALQGTEAVYGGTKVKTLADGTKAVLYESKAGPTTIAIQDAAGRTVTKIRY